MRNIESAESDSRHPIGHGSHRLVAACLFAAIAVKAMAGEVGIIVRENGKLGPLPCRIHIEDSEGRNVLPAGFPAFQTHITIPGEASLSLKAGHHKVSIERGPEYARIETVWDVPDDGTIRLEYALQRLACMAQEGWWSGDLHVHRSPAEIEAIMRGEDLHVAPVITWWRNRRRWISVKSEAPFRRTFDTNRIFDLSAGEDERDGGAVQFFGLEEPLPVDSLATNGRPTSLFLKQARRLGAIIAIEKPFWNDVPIWLASGAVSTIEIANNHMLRHGVVDSEAWGRARDRVRLKGPHGNGLWSQEIYYQILETGIRLPPSAGSASGVLPNPVGYNRVYVHMRGEPSYEDWWAGLLAGRTFVTNGPLLRMTANGELPGHIFRISPGASTEVKLQVQIDSRDPISRIELIYNGRIERVISGSDWLRGKRFEPLRLNRNGWFLIRTIADVDFTFRFASTAPYYVESIGKDARISRAAALFFLNWTRDRLDQIQALEAGVREEAIAIVSEAESYWLTKLDAANAP